MVCAGVPTARAMAAVPTAQLGIAEAISYTVAQQSATTQATLTLQDLPPGFTELPPELAAQVSSRLDALRQQLGQGNLQPENFFAFVNPQTSQVVLGFTGKLPNESEQSSFDTSLQQIQQPEVQQLFRNQLQERLRTFGEVKVTQYSSIPEANGLANASTGIRLGLEMQGQPLQLDFAAFRRNSVGAFTAIMYTNSRQPALGVGDLARKLDSRIVESSANAKSSSLAKVR